MSLKAGVNGAAAITGTILILELTSRQIGVCTQIFNFRNAHFYIRQFELRIFDNVPNDSLKCLVTVEIQYRHIIGPFLIELLVSRLS